MSISETEKQRKIYEMGQGRIRNNGLYLRPNGLKYEGRSSTGVWQAARKSDLKCGRGQAEDRDRPDTLEGSKH